MNKGERTRNDIIQKASVLFNRSGFQGTSISEVMAATGLQKGGIYRHFDSKDELALAAFDHALTTVNSHYLDAIRSSSNAIARLIGIVDAFSLLQHEEPISGGCPIMNTAIDSDDGHPQLRRKARKALTDWHQMLTAIINRGIQRQEIKPEVDSAAFATQMIGLMEGGLMMSRLSPDHGYFTHTISTLKEQIKALRTDPATG